MAHRRTALAILAAVSASAALSCATAPPRGAAPAPAPAAAAPAPHAPAPSARATAPLEGGGLLLSVVPPDAEVLIDGRSRGKVADLGRDGLLLLPPGLYQVSLVRPGFTTWRAEVSVRTTLEPLQVTLPRKPAAP